MTRFIETTMKDFVNIDYICNICKYKSEYENKIKYIIIFKSGCKAEITKENYDILIKNYGVK